ncbi:MAG: outer membrane protein transport protein [Xanthomonadales bacterium]|nr:outer membrane protein transport protein [Xanthomonadales bacterium]
MFAKLAIRLIWTGLCSLCVIPSANATGFNFWESSALNSSLAAANGARARDASVLALAPSSITQLQDTQLSATLNFYSVATDYEIFGQEANYEVANPVPSGFFVLPLRKNWHFGLGIFSRTAADISVPRIPLLNPNEVRLQPILVSLTPSLAYRWGSLSLGMSLEYIYADYGFDQTICRPTTGCNEINLEGKNHGWSGNLSTTWQISERLTLALSHQLASDFSDENLQVALPPITRVYLSAQMTEGLYWHNSYSYSQWKDKGMSFTGYPDNLGLLVGQANSHRYATGLDYEIDKWRIGLGFSVDQAIDSFGGSDYRYRVGGGYQLADRWALDFNFMYESYAAKSADISGTPVVKVQNRGSSFSLGLRYLFE